MSLFQYSMSITSLFIIVVLVLGSILEYREIIDFEKMIVIESVTGVNQYNVNGVKNYSVLTVFNNNIEIFFCNSNSYKDSNMTSYPCFNTYYEIINSTQDHLYCAFQELDERYLIDTLLQKSQHEDISISIIIEDSYFFEEEFNRLKNTSIELISDENRNSRYNNLMHQKFCILDNDTVIFGSANPTINGMYYNDNVVLRVKSKDLYNEFLEEFLELRNERFGSSKRIGNFTAIAYEVVNVLDNISSHNVSDNILNDTLGNTSQIAEFEVLFCPQEDCEEKLVEVLNASEESIYFATFVLTLDSAEEILLQKLHQNISIKGVVEPRLMNVKGSRIKEFVEVFNMSIRKDTNPRTMHHKLFIIDNETMVFGSMNPSASGVYYNDEFVVILNSKQYARDFLEEFDKLWNTSIEIE